MIDRLHIKELLNEAEPVVPIRTVEVFLGMPLNTLQKFLIGERGLPVKWHKKVKAYVGLYQPKKPANEPKMSKKKRTVITNIEGLSNIDKLQKLRVKDL